MNPPLLPLQILNLIQADHDILSKAIKNFRKSFVGNLPPANSRQLPAIRQLLVKKIPDHFAEEENQLFPILLATDSSPKITTVLDELRQDHIQLQAEAQRLDAHLERNRLTQCPADLGTTLLDFFIVFEKHVAKEDQLFKNFT